MFTMCVSGARRGQTGVKFPGTRVMNGCVPHVGRCWEPNQGPSQEPQVPLTTEPSSLLLGTPIFRRFVVIFNHARVCAHADSWAVSVPHRAELQTVVSRLAWVLGTKSGFPGRAVCAFHHCSEHKVDTLS